MILYHGSVVDVSEPRIIKSEIGRDFGFAFCMERSLKTLRYMECDRIEV